MNWQTRWHVLLVVVAGQTLAQSVTPTVCEDESCRCDAFTRVICNCTRNYDEVTLRPQGAYRVPSTTTDIIIDGCARVYFLSHTAQNLLQLRSIEIRNVHHVYIHEWALSWSPFSPDVMNPGIRIIIHNSTVNEIASHAIRGRVNEILISNSRFNNIESFAFSSLVGTENVELTGNVFEKIKSQAFKGMSTTNFLLRGGYIQTIPSMFISKSEVRNVFQIDGVTVRSMESSSFIVSSPKRVLIENNNIGTIMGTAFAISARGPIILRNNTIQDLQSGALLSFSAEFEVTSVLGRQELLIDNNTFTNLTPSSLMYNQSTLTLRVDGLNLNMVCACDLGEEWRIFLKERGSAFSCWYPLESYYVTIPTYVASRCGNFKQNYWIFILVGILLIIGIAGLVTYFIVKKENEKKKKVQIVMPDGKTYKETEFHIVVERAELLTTDL